MSGLGGLNKSRRTASSSAWCSCSCRWSRRRPTSRAQTAAHRRDGRQGAAQPRRPWTSWSSPNTRCTASSMDTNPAIMCTLDGPEVAAFTAGLHRERASGAASRSWSSTPAAIPTIRASSSTTRGELQLYYRKLHPWVPVEPWEPGDLGIPVIDGPKGCKLGADHLPRRHVPGDGARGRLQGRRDHAAHRRLHRADPPGLALHQPGQRVPQPDGDRQRLHVRLGRHLRLDGRGDDRQFRRHDHRRRARPAAPTRSSPPRCGPTWCARRAPTGASRTTSTSSATAASPRSRAARRIAPTPTCRTSSPARYRLPWEAEVKVTDGTVLAASPSRPARYGEKFQEAAE